MFVLNYSSWSNRFGGKFAWFRNIIWFRSFAWEIFNDFLDSQIELLKPRDDSSFLTKENTSYSSALNVAISYPHFTVAYIRDITIEENYFIRNILDIKPLRSAAAYKIVSGENVPIPRN